MRNRGPAQSLGSFLIALGLGGLAAALLCGTLWFRTNDSLQRWKLAASLRTSDPTLLTPDVWNILPYTYISKNTPPGGPPLMKQRPELVDGPNRFPADLSDADLTRIDQQISENVFRLTENEYESGRFAIAVLSFALIAIFTGRLIRRRARRASEVAYDDGTDDEDTQKEDPSNEDNDSR